MKTTIDLPDEILHRAKIVAAQKKTTLKDLVLCGLQIVLYPGVKEIQTDDLADALSNGHNMQPIGRLGREEIYERAVLRGH